MSQNGNMSNGLDEESRKLLAKGLSTAAASQSMGLVSNDPAMTATRRREQEELNRDMVELNKELQQKRAAFVAGQAAPGAPGTVSGQKTFGRKRKAKADAKVSVADVNSPATVNIPEQPGKTPIAPVTPLPPNLTAEDMALIENVKKSRARSREEFFKHRDSVHPGAVDARPEYANETYRNPIKMLNGEREDEVAKYAPPPEYPQPPKRPAQEQLMPTMERTVRDGAQHDEKPRFLNSNNGLEAWQPETRPSPSLESLGLDAVNYHALLNRENPSLQPAEPVDVRGDGPRFPYGYTRESPFVQYQQVPLPPVPPVVNTPVPQAVPDGTPSWDDVNRMVRQYPNPAVTVTPSQQTLETPPMAAQPASVQTPPPQGEPQLPPYVQPQVRQTPAVRHSVVDPSRPGRNYEEFSVISGWPSKSVFYPGKVYGQSLLTVDAIKLSLADDDEIADILDDILSRRIKGVDPGDILTSDEEYLMYWLRASSYPSQAGHGLPKVKFTCPHCGHRFRDAQSLSTIEPITFLDLDFVADTDPVAIAEKHARDGYARFTAYDGREVHIYLRRRKHDSVIREYEEKWEELTRTYLPKYRQVELAAAAVIEIEDCKDMNEKLDYIEGYPLDERVNLFQAIGDAQVVSHTVANIRCPFCGGTASVPYPFQYRQFVASL